MDLSPVLDNLSNDSQFYNDRRSQLSTNHYRLFLPSLLQPLIQPQTFKRHLPRFLPLRLPNRSNTFSQLHGVFHWHLQRAHLSAQPPLLRVLPIHNLFGTKLYLIFCDCGESFCFWHVLTLAFYCDSSHKILRPGRSRDVFVLGGKNGAYRGISKALKSGATE